MAGCVSTHPPVASDGRGQGIAAAQAPRFLIGPPGVLLTNAADYRARLTVIQTNRPAESISGNLFQQEGWLLFIPSVELSAERGGWAGRFRFLWDANRRTGYVLSEALQGYAPVKASTQDVAILQDPATGSLGSERVGDRECLIEDISFRSGATRRRFRVARSEDPAAPPVQIRSLDENAGLTIHLSELEVERLSPELFSAPTRFSRYESGEAMVRELMRKAPVMPYTHSH